MAKKLKLVANKREIATLVFAVSVLLTSGTVFYTIVEHWWWFNSLYFSTMTLATVGFGDLSPATTAGRAFTLFYVIAGIGLFLSLITHLAEHTRQRYVKQSENYIQQLQQNVKEFFRDERE